jgi:adenosylcobyric acid synthase
LGLLPLDTIFAQDKTVKRTTASFGTLHGPWQALSNVLVTGYEIHHGVTHASAPVSGLAWQSSEGNVLGIYLHGMFEDSAVLRALWGADAPSLDSVFEGLANFLDTHVDTGVLSKLVAKLAST